MAVLPDLLSLEPGKPPYCDVLEFRADTAALKSTGAVVSEIESDLEVATHCENNLVEDITGDAFWRHTIGQNHSICNVESVNPSRLLSQ